MSPPPVIRTLPRDHLARYYEQYGPRIFRYCRAYLSDVELAHDAAQEVFLRLARYGHRCELVENKEAWLVQVARNCCRDLIRRCQRDRAVEHGLSAEPRVSEQEPSQGLSLLLGRLAQHPKVGERDLLLLKLLSESWQTSDIANEIGISPQAVNKRRRRLAAIIRELEEGNDASHLH